jgi:uncharacterized protein YlxW (UPF0749 family)
VPAVDAPVHDVPDPRPVDRPVVEVPVHDLPDVSPADDLPEPDPLVSRPDSRAALPDAALPDLRSPDVEIPAAVLPDASLPSWPHPDHDPGSSDEVGVRAVTELPAAGPPGPGAGPHTSPRPLSTSPDDAGDDDGDSVTPRRRLIAALRPSLSRGQVLAGLLCGVLGFALVVQARQNSEGTLGDLRQSELVTILANITDRSSRLEQEAAQLQARRDALRSATDKSQAAQDAARERLDALGILAGTSSASGPGITLDISDPTGQVTAALVLDTVQELRDAGAEAIQIGSARVVASTAFEDADGGIRVDRTLLQAPYRMVVIGDPQTLSSALDIPGGILAVLKQREAEGRVRQSDSVTITALHPIVAPQYARPAPIKTP